MWIAYFLAVASPGPAQVYVIDNTTIGPKSRGQLAALGISLGTSIWVLSVSFGLGRLIQDYPFTRDALRYLSILLLGYFLMLSIRRLLFDKVIRGATAHALPTNDKIRIFTRGVLVNLLNPGAVVFFISLFSPMLIAAKSQRAVMLCAVGIMCISVLWYQTLVQLVAFHWVKRFVARSDKSFRLGFTALYAYFIYKLLKM